MRYLHHIKASSDFFSASQIYILENYLFEYIYMWYTTLTQFIYFPFVVVQSLSSVWLSANPQTVARLASLFFTISWSLLKLISLELMIPSNHLIICYLLLLLPSIFPNIKVFSSESALHIRWQKDRSFSISPSNEYSGLVSFKMDWLDLLAVQGTLKSLLQHHSSKAKILWCSAIFIVQLSHVYMTMGKTIHSFDYMDPYRQSDVAAF